MAARAYGAIIDLFPSRADLRRMAGNRLERLATPEALALAVDTYEKAKEERADHPSSHRMHGWPNPFRTGDIHCPKKIRKPCLKTKLKTWK